MMNWTVLSPFRWWLLSILALLRAANAVLIYWFRDNLPFWRRLNLNPAADEVVSSASPERVVMMRDHASILDILHD